MELELRIKALEQAAEESESISLARLCMFAVRGHMMESEIIPLMQDVLKPEDQDDYSIMAELEYEQEQAEAQAMYEAEAQAEEEARAQAEADAQAQYEAEQCYYEEEYWE